MKTTFRICEESIFASQRQASSGQTRHPPDLTHTHHKLQHLPLWSRRPNHRACSTKMPPSQSYKRRYVACQHFPDDQTAWLQAGAGEDDFIHLLRGPDHVACDRQKEEEEPISSTSYASSVGIRYSHQYLEFLYFVG